MKILIPLVEFGKAGGYRVLSNLANEWIKVGNQVDFIVPIASIKPYFPTNAGIYWVNKNGDFCAETEQVDARLYRFWHRWMALFRGIRNIQNNYDIILANHSLTAYPVAFSNVRGKKYYYIQAYEPEYGKLNGSLGHKILSIIAWNSYNLNLNKIVNADLYKRYKNIKSNKVVLPGLDLNLFYEKKDLHFSKTVKIGCVGRIEPYKGTKYVLEAFEILFKQQIDVELYIAFGDEALVNKNQYVFVVTPKNDKELAEFYRSMDIIIAPGTVQLGAVHYPVIESMATKTPIITTNYYPANNSNAWLVPIKSAKSIAAQVINIIENPELRLQKTNQALMDIKQFEWKKVASDMYNYFLEN